MHLLHTYPTTTQLTRASWDTARVTGLALACMVVWAMPAVAVTVSSNPLYLSTSAPPNVLLTLSNSQSMDENGNPANGSPIGAAIGASSPDSKSEIARGVIRTMASTYLNQINLGLMTFQQNTPGSKYIYNSLYDASYNPSNYVPSPVQAKSSPQKSYRITNPADTTNYIYYNWPSPFYDTASYPQNFCYSNTAKFDNTTNISSPYDTYRCFNIKTGTSDGIVSPLPASSVTSATLAEQAYGYQGAKIYQGSFVPTDSDYATNTLDFGKLIPSIYTATSWFSATSPGMGYLQVPVAQLTTTLQTTLNNKLTCNMPTAPVGAPKPNPTPTSGVCNSNSNPTSTSVLNAGLTAIEGTIKDTQLYYAGTLPTSRGYTVAPPNSCNHNYSILLTNGLPSVSATGTVPTLSNGQIDICTLTSQAVAAANTLRSSGTPLYVVGYAMLPQVLQNYTALCNNTTNPMDQLAAAGGTSQAYLASDPATLQTALNSVFSSIIQASGSSAALTSNSTSITSTSYVYQGSFNSGDWSGHLKAFQLSASGAATTPTWDAASQLPAPASRAIYTWNGSAGTTFSWGNLTTNQQCYLASQAPGCTLTAAQTTSGQNVLNYLRGDATNETCSPAPCTAFRARPVTKLGDIINSSPLYLSTEDYGYSILAGSEGSSYSSFLATKASNPPMIYVGANDGMLHAFDASASGVEKAAYVPNAVYNNLASLTSSTYNSNHKTYVDGTPASGDAYYGGAWHTILLGTLGATSGTNALFALDITNPNSLSASSALWEVSDANNLGNTWGQGAVARMNDGHYYAVVNNGYNSVSKRAVLFMIQVDNPSNIIKLDTGVGGGTVDNGLSQAALLDANDDGTIDAIYAGDLQGNVWKFDVSSTNHAQWKVAFSSGSTNYPLFKARDAMGNVQPITAPLELGSVPAGATGTTQVFVGTGQYLNTTDLTNMATQSFYGVLDTSTYASGAFTGGSNSTTRATQVAGVNVLVQQSIVFENTTTRAVSSNSVNYATGALGWYLDLLQPPSATQQGERVISKPLLRSGRVLFPTLIPSTATCTAGGTGWLLELDAASGGSPSYTFLDMNNDGSFNSADNVTLASGASVPAVGVRTSSGFGTTPVSTTNGGSYVTTTSLSSGGLLNSPPTLVITGNPRTSWSQIK